MCSANSSRELLISAVCDAVLNIGKNIVRFSELAAERHLYQVQGRVFSYIFAHSIIKLRVFMYVSVGGVRNQQNIIFLRVEATVSTVAIFPKVLG